MAAPKYLTDHDPAYGECVTVAPGIRRVTANNPSKFTFYGTGTYLVGDDDLAVIDAGPRLPEHVDAVMAAIGSARVTHILVTHTHGDHSPSTAALAEATGATTYGFGPHPTDAVDEAAAARELIDDDDSDDEPMSEEERAREREMHRPDDEFVPDVAVAHGDLIEGVGFTFEALHTPGHISNHLCFAHRESNSLFSGDHVMGWSTTIIPPPNGDMGDYLDSLRLLLDRTEDVYYPTHGPSIPEPRQFVVDLLEHRLDRERQVVALLADGPHTIVEMVKVMYADVDKKLHKAAAKSVESHLVYLERHGRVHRATFDDQPSVFSLASQS